MRVLSVGSLYPPHHLGGYELVWQAAMEALRAAGHDVTVLCTDTRIAPRAVEPDPDWVRRDLRWYWRDHGWPAFSLGERLALERHDHDVLTRELERGVDVVSWWAMGGMPLSLVERIRRAGVPAIGWVNDDWLVYGPEVDRWMRTWRRLPVRTVRGLPTRVDLRRGARWVFCSESVRTAAQRLRGPLADSAVHYQGVAPDFVRAPERPGWDGRLLVAGRLDPRKGLATVVAALPYLADAKLTIIGDGDHEVAGALRAQAEALGVASRVDMQPARPRSALALAYAEADAVLFPVEWAEPWGLVPLEAMAVGRPVIATGRGGSGEYLVDGENCLRFGAGDAAGLAAAVARLAGDAALRSRLREGGFATTARLNEAAWTANVVVEHVALASRSAAGRGPA